jgi:tetratricopeptide (TPR) repeat protein
VASPAGAQSKRYPPMPPDLDRDAEQRSGLWEAALDPDTGPYRELVRDARRLLEGGAAKDRETALAKLDAAIARLPREPDAFTVRGQHHLAMRQWENCADDLGRAEDYTRQADPVTRTRPRLDRGVCLARAGRLGEAERVLAGALASAQSHRGELAMRLGEVRIALGKLDEAIDALGTAIDINDSAASMARWLIAAAFDRARRPTEADERTKDAKRGDQSMYTLEATSAWLSPAEPIYLYGLAYRHAVPLPEYALVYFRRYLQLAPDAPWRRRAEEHVRELAAVTLPSRDAIKQQGNATFDLDVVQTTIRRSMPAMRACLARLPQTAFQVWITKPGKRREPTRDRPYYRMPPASVKAETKLDLDGAPRAALDTAKSCVEKIADKMALPMPTERDTYYGVSFYVVSP